MKHFGILENFFFCSKQKRDIKLISLVAIFIRYQVTSPSGLIIILKCELGPCDTTYNKRAFKCGDILAFNYKDIYYKQKTF